MEDSFVPFFLFVFIDLCFSFFFFSVRLSSFFISSYCFACLLFLFTERRRDRSGRKSLLKERENFHRSSFSLSSSSHQAPSLSSFLSRRSPHTSLANFMKFSVIKGGRESKKERKNKVEGGGRRECKRERSGQDRRDLIDSIHVSEKKSSSPSC